MIAVDTSALMAIVGDEPEAMRCRSAIDRETEIVISAGTMAEALIVAGGRNVGATMRRLLDGIQCKIVPVTAASAIAIGEIYRQWGKGIHPAGLNFGDCFAYEVAKQHSCPLLFVGQDFARTDIKSAL
ncbi:MAG: type II toxin-antitoxin system VapC family toxin [Stellaceae bacterium]